MRDNNKYYVDYIDELEEQGITPEMEVDDIVELIKDHEELTDLKYKLKQFKANLQAGVLVRVGRKNLMPAEYLQTFMCIPAELMGKLERKRPWIKEPQPDGTVRVRYDLTPEEKELYKLYHWIYLEMEVILYRLTD